MPHYTKWFQVAFAAASLEVVPSSLAFGPSDCIGATFTITVEVHNVANLYGVDIQIGWDENWIEYSGREKQIPVETYPNGILHSPTIQVKDEVDEIYQMPGADPNSHYWLVETSLNPAASFNGSGIAFAMTFTIKKQPLVTEPDKMLTLDITVATLADKAGNPIPYSQVDGAVEIKARQLTYPNKPLLKVLPEVVANTEAGTTFDSSILLAAWNNKTNMIEDLDPFWDVTGFDVVYNFDPTLIEAINLTIDPTEWFTDFWPKGISIINHSIDNVAGTVQITFIGLPDLDGTHIAPAGIGYLAKITFRAKLDFATYPPPSCDLKLDPTRVVTYPHPERLYPPWTDPDLTVSTYVQNATYTAVCQPAGAYMDIYTQYPYPYGGQGLGKPSDMYWPQKEVCLFANVSYNLWPEQQKDVLFEVRGPNGTVLTILCARTNADGVAAACFRLPWPCESPEAYFGIWTIRATVDVACTVVNDSLQFKYGYHLRVWKTVLDSPSYQHGEYMRVTVSYGTQSMQTFVPTFTATGTDETGVALSYSRATQTVGGARWCTYKNGTITFSCLYIPKWARLGLGTVYVSALHALPTDGGDAIYPTKKPETIVEFGIMTDIPIRVWETTLDKTSYKHEDKIIVTIHYGAMSMQPFQVLFTATAIDPTGVAFSTNSSWTVASGLGLFVYMNSSVTLSLDVPKYARAGIGTIYVGVFLGGMPDAGGRAIFPAEESTVVYFRIEDG